MASDKIEIPIEVSTSDIKDIKSLVKELKQAESGVKKVKDTSSNQAVSTLELPERVNLAAAGIQTTPRRGSFDPIGVKTENNIIKEQSKRLDKVEEGMNLINKTLGFASNPLGSITGLVSKLAPQVMVALFSIGLVELIIKELFKDGGPLDRRFKEFDRRVNKLISTRDEAELLQVLRTVRITSYYGSRGGRNTTFSTLDGVRNGETLFDRDLHLLTKGVTE